MIIASGSLSKKKFQLIFWTHSHLYSQRWRVIAHLGGVKPPGIKGLPTENIPMLQDGSVCIYEPYPPTPTPPATCWEEIMLSVLNFISALERRVCARVVARACMIEWEITAGKVRCAFNLTSPQVQYERTVEAECVEAASPLWLWTQHWREKWRKRRQSIARLCACALCLVLSFDYSCFHFPFSVVLLKTIIKIAENVFMHIGCWRFQIKSHE